MQIIPARSEAVRPSRGSRTESLLTALDLDMPGFPDLERLIDWINRTDPREGERG
ncbi:hypothetical protein [Antarctobacter jejuensis]|uniref:hypothetical protein n=1 Tax=Antarctobacter jejuensis TaxID=1439938 RepID=UPI003FD0A66F